MTLQDLHKQSSTFDTTEPMPILFLGHGNPMNAIETNEFTQQWKLLGNTITKPRAIVCISAHWETKGTFVTMSQQPETIHDFYGFPQELYQQQYPASGSPELAQNIIKGTLYTPISGDYRWGLDHGAWSVLKHVYPEANTPVIQISIDHYKGAAWHYQLGKALGFLRTKGVLVVGSGNMIHNLRILQVPNNDFNAEHGYEWAFKMNEIFKKEIINDNHDSLIKYQSLHKESMLAIPTPEHYIPMLYALAMKNEGESIKIFNDKVIAGSLSMTSFIIGGK